AHGGLLHGVKACNARWVQHSSCYVNDRDGPGVPVTCPVSSVIPTKTVPDTLACPSRRPRSAARFSAPKVGCPVFRPPFSVLSGRPYLCATDCPLPSPLQAHIQRSRYVRPP